MNIPESPRGTRDRDVRLTRRLRAGVVSAGVIGSLGVAGAVGYATANAHAGSAAPTASQGDGANFVFPQSNGQTTQNYAGQGDDAGEGGDDGGGQLQQVNPNTLQAPTQLQPGSGGQPQAQSSGS